MRVDEDGLRHGLRALTATPAPLSGDLAERSVRTAVVRRRRRVALTGVAVAAAVVAAVPVTAPLRRPPAPLPFAKALLSWPDGRDPGYLRQADTARAEFERFSPSLVPVDSTVRWLYAGPIHTDKDRVLVVWAYCVPGWCSRVALASAEADSVVTGTEQGVSGWTLRSGDVEAGVATTVSTLLLGPQGPHGYTNVLVALAPPHTTAVRWSSPSRRPGTGGSGVLDDRGRGLYVADVGYLSAPVRLVIEGRTPYDGRVAVAAEAAPPVGNAPTVPAVTVPASFTLAFSGGDQLDNPASFVDHVGHTGRAAVFARCEGKGRVVLRLEGRQGRVDCDGAQHTVLVDVPISGELVLEVSPGDPYASLSYAVGTR